MWQQRLLSRMNDSSRVLVVNAEPGSGKTVLAAEWARSRQLQDLPTVWVLLDDAAAQSAPFWSRIAIGLCAVLPQAATTALGPALGAPSQASVAIAAISAALIVAPHSLAMVIDDLHVAAPSVQQEFASFVERTPWLHVVVTTRLPTVLERPSVRAALSVDVLGFADLALRPSEIVELGRKGHVNISESEAENLRRLTGGSERAVRVAIAHIRSSEAEADSTRSRTRQQIEHSLAIAAEGMLDELVTGSERQLARRFSLSPELDEPLAVKISGRTDAWAVVNSFEQLGLGRITADPRGRTVFTFFALPLAGLREEARLQLSLEERRAIQMSAARRLTAHGDPVEVLRLFIDVGLDRAVWGQFIRRRHEIGPDRRSEVIDLLHGLPRERIEKEGTLAMMLAVMVGDRPLRQSGRTERLIRVGLAELQARPMPSEPTDRFLLRLACFAGNRALRDYPKAKSIAQQILRATVDFETSVQVRTARSQSMVIDFILVHLLARDLEGAIEMAALLTDESYPMHRAQRSALLAICHTLRGDMQGAEREVRVVEAADGTDLGSPPVSTALRLARGHLMLERGDLLEAFTELDGLRLMAQECELWPIILWTGAYTRLVSGGAERGAVELERALHGLNSAVISPLWEEMLRALRADLLLASGSAGQAAKLIEGSAISPPIHHALVRLQLVTGKPEEALSRLNAARTLPLSPREATDYHLLVASAQQRLGRAAVAKQALERGLHLMRETRLRSLLSFITREDLADLRPLAPDTLWLEPLAQPFSMTTLGEALTEREALILVELVGGDPISLIADRLHVSPNTVKSQLRSVYRKLGVSGREEALRAAVSYGLL